MTVASGVMMSVFVSPVIAAVTVGKEQATTWPPSVLHTEEKEEFKFKISLLLQN